MKRLLPLIPLLVVVLCFEGLMRTGVLSAYLFASPTQVVDAFFESKTEYLSAFFETAQSSVLGLCLSVFVGLVIASVLSLSTVARALFYPYAVFFQTVPIIAIAPLLVIWFGYGLKTVIASSFIVSVFPIIANSVTGFLSVNPLQLQLFQLLKASRVQTLFKLRIPEALPQILSGVRIASGLSVIGAIVGEFISGTGLGGVVDTARTQGRIDRVFAAVLCAAVLGMVFFAAISFLNYWLLSRWHPSEAAVEK